MIQLAIVMLPFAAIAFAVAIAAIALAALLPKRRKNCIPARGDVKIVFMDANGQPQPEEPDQKGDTVSPAPVESEIINVRELRPPQQKDVIPPAATEQVGQMEVDAVKDTQRIAEVPPHRRGFGSFLRFGMSRKREDVNAPASPLQGEQEAAIVESSMDTTEPPRRRRLFSGGKSSRVVRAAAEPASSDDVPSESETQSVSSAVASVTTEEGTTSVDARGVIHEQPAEAEFPVQRFAENDRAQDVAYASEAERREAEHRMEMERLQAEQEAYDAEQRRALELKEAKHRRGLEILETRARLRNEAKEVDAVAQASIEAHLAKWWIRLDPDVKEPQEAERIRLAGSLESARAPWAAKLICTALEQDDSERVRARLIGALARGYRSEAAPFEAALTRSQIERWAIIESLTPFAADAPWIADILNRAKGETVTPESSSAEPSQAPSTDVSDANVIPLPPPAAVPAVDTEAIVAAAS